MKFIRQGATHKVVIGPAVAVGDGFTPVTNLTLSGADEAEAILHDNGTVVDVSGYTWAAITTADGYYHLTLHGDISGTVGHLTLVVNDDSLVLPLRADFTVIEEAVYDAMFASSAPGYVANAPVNVAQVSGDSTSADNLELAYDGTGYAGGTIKQGVDVVAISGDSTAADNLEAAADGDGYNLGGGSITAASVTGAVGSVTGAVGSVAGNVSGSVGSLATQAKADVNAEVVDALSTDTHAEPSSVPAATSSLKDKIGWMFTLMRNKRTQTSTTETLRNDADGSNIGTSTKGDDGTTLTRGEWT